MQAVSVLFSLIRYEIIGTPIDNEIKKSLDIKTLESVFLIAKTHDLGHLIIDAIEKNNLLPSNLDEDDEKFFAKAKQVRDTAIFRDIKREYETQHIESILENNKIEFVPLKGSVIKKYYPETWMRTSCDIDILVHEDDINKAVELLKSEGYETDNAKSDHDVSLYCGNVHLELHFNAYVDNCNKEKDINNILLNVWDNTVKVNEYKYQENNEFFVFHLITHMAKHFSHGGCGIRPLIDLWLINNKIAYDKNKVEDMCKQAGLTLFYNQIIKLSEIWLEEKEYDKDSKEIEEYILKAGVYGSTENSMAITTAKKGSKINNIFSYVFLPYKYLKIRYPILVKYKILTPIFEVVRWFSTIFNGRMKNVSKRIKLAATQTDEKIQSTKELFDKLGL